MGFILSSAPPRSPTNPVMEEQLPTRHALAALDVVYEMSTVLDTGLSKSELAILMGLCENSVNPEALAAVVKELRREGAALAGASAEISR